jgi:hypothetical protein
MQALLQSLPATSPLPGFSNLWLRVLRVLQVGTPVFRASGHSSYAANILTVCIRIERRSEGTLRSFALQECTNSRSDELVEHVPEALKNTLMVMHGSGVLVPSWKVRDMLSIMT